MGRAVVWMLIAGVSVVGVVAPHAEALIVINEVLADPAALSGDANGDGIVSSAQDEFVELVNTDEQSVSLAHWTLADAVQVRHVFAEAAAIPGYGLFVIFGGGNPQGFANVAVASTGTLSLNNGGDAVTLRDATAALVGSLTYGAEGGKDVSLTRMPDATGPFVLHSTANGQPFSPGRTLDGRTQLPFTTVGLPPLPQSSPVVPEPGPLFLLGGSILSLIKRRRRRI